MLREAQPWENEAYAAEKQLIRQMNYFHKQEKKEEITRFIEVSVNVSVT